MKRFFIVLLMAGLFAGCGSSNSNNTKIDIPSDLPFNKKILSERIKGPVEAFDVVQNFPVVNLYDYAVVEALPKGNGWTDIGIWIDLTKTPIEDNQLWPETKLITIDGYEIGEVIAATYLEPEFENEAFLGLMIQDENIRTELLPETILSDIINSGSFSKDDCKVMLSSFEFKSSGNIDGFEEYMIPDCTIDDPSPRDRITLMFEVGELASVVHSRNLSVPNYETIELVRGHKITILKDLTDNEKQQLAQRKIDFYNSID